MTIPLMALVMWVVVIPAALVIASSLMRRARRSARLRGNNRAVLLLAPRACPHAGRRREPPHVQGLTPVRARRAAGMRKQ